MTDDKDPKIPLPWKVRKTPKRGTRRARNWRRIYPGYSFPDTLWTVTEGPYQRIRNGRSHTWVTVRCGRCEQEFSRRLDGIIAGRSHACLSCAAHINKPWEHRHQKPDPEQG